MARVKGAMMTRKRRNKILKLAKGYWGAKSKHYKTRINAACKLNGMNYSTFMNGLKKSGIVINRKMLAELAVNDKAAFVQLTETAKKALA